MRMHIAYTNTGLDFELSRWDSSWSTTSSSLTDAVQAMQANVPELLGDILGTMGSCVSSDYCAGGRPGRGWGQRFRKLEIALLGRCPGLS